MPLRPFFTFLACICLVGCSPSRSSRDAVTQSHTVQAGDTLAGIAEKYYGDSIQWKRIYEANHDQLGQHIDMQVGLVLTIPPQDAAAQTQEDVCVID